MSKTITKQCLIILSVLVFYPVLVQADAPAKLLPDMRISSGLHKRADAPVTILPNMRMSAGLHKRSDGSFCAIDPRGKSALTPSFVKPSLSAKPFTPKGVPVCNAQETKAFQKKIKTAYLQTRDGAQLQKTMGGAVLGNVMKGMGVGCVVVAGANLIVESMTALFRFAKNNDTLRTNNRESLTEAKGICVECAFFGLLGGISGAFMGFARDDKAIKKITEQATADLHKEVIPVEEAALKEQVQKMSAADIEKNLQAESKTLNSLKKQLKSQDSRMRAILNQDRYSIALDLKEYERLEQEAKVIERQVKVQNQKMQFWRSMRAEPGAAKAIHTAAVQRVNALTYEELLEKVPRSKREAIIQKRGKALHMLPGTIGMLSGAAGAVICHEGMVFYLRKEDTQI